MRENHRVDALLPDEAHELSLAVDVEHVLAVNHVVLVRVAVDEETRHVVLVAQLHRPDERDCLVVCPIDQHRLSLAPLAHLNLNHVVGQYHAYTHEYQPENRQ